MVGVIRCAVIETYNTDTLPLKREFVWELFRAGQKAKTAI